MDRVKLWQLILSITVAVCGVAASWGASRVSIAQAASDVVTIQTELVEVHKEMESLKITNAVTNEVLKNIDKKLTEIQDDLDKLDKKLDNLRK